MKDVRIDGVSATDSFGIRFGDLQNPENGKTRPSQVAAFLEETADPQPCPTEIPFFEARFPTRPNGEPQRCQGGPGFTSWYGYGQVNALTAVTHSPANQP